MQSRATLLWAFPLLFYFNHSGFAQTGVDQSDLIQTSAVTLSPFEHGGGGGHPGGGGGHPGGGGGFHPGGGGGFHPGGGGGYHPGGGGGYHPGGGGGYHPGGGGGYHPGGGGGYHPGGGGGYHPGGGGGYHPGYHPGGEGYHPGFHPGGHYGHIGGGYPIPYYGYGYAAPVFYACPVSYYPPYQVNADYPLYMCIAASTAGDDTDVDNPWGYYGQDGGDWTYDYMDAENWALQNCQQYYASCYLTMCFQY